ncbi:MAG: hypothetical protein KAJ57_00620 [Woeseiaceae bacterium]|nr:hypothetical protein [Woeseiaceae bacterium]
MNEKDMMQEQELLELLKDYPVPQAQAGFYDQALVQAAHQGTRRQRNRWMLTGFGSAIAAGFAIWVITATLMTTPQVPDVDPTIPGVTVMLEEEHTVRLMFASAMALDSATLTVSLPEGIELAGFPGQREITWETSLEEGKNLLPLTLIALTPAGGELLARLEHKDRSQTFRLRVEVS